MWEVIGFEAQENDEGQITAYTVYLAKPFKEGQGHGKRCKRYWYRTNEQSYVPDVGDTVMVETEVRGKYEVLLDIAAV